MSSRIADHTSRREEKGKALPHQQFSDPREQRRNLFLNIVEGASTRLSAVLVHPTTVLVGILAALGASTFVTGLTVGAAGLLQSTPQVFSAQVFAGRRRYRPLLIYLRLARGTPWALLAICLLFGLAQRPTAAILAVLLTVWISAVLSGVFVPPWLEFITRILKPTERGKFYGWRISLGAITGTARLVHCLWCLMRRSFGFRTDTPVVSARVPLQHSGRLP